MNNKVVEIAKFKLKKGITASDFLAEDKVVQKEVLSQQPGYISRKTVKSEDGEWADIVWWESMDEAKKAAKAIMVDEKSKTWVGMMDESAISLYHGHLIAEFN